MATKRNIARSGSMSKSFYQSTKSKRTRNHRHRRQDHRAAKTTRPRSDAQSSASASKTRPPTHKNHMSTIGRADQSQKPHVTKNHKTTHTRTTQEPQRQKTRKVACRAGLQSVWHARTTKTTKTTWACGSSHGCGYLWGYSLYFYIILYIYKSECE